MAMERDEMEMIGRFQRLGLYYTLGGAHAVPPSLGDMLRVKPLPGFQVGGGYSCGKFDFRHQMQDILGWLEGLLLPLGLLWVVYAAGGYAMRGLDALGPSADPTGIGMATRVGTGGMARNISRR